MKRKEEKILPFNVHLHPALAQEHHSYESRKKALYSDVGKTIKILGIEENPIKSNQTSYATEILKDFPLKHEGLQKHLQQYPHINVLCQDPATMSLMVFICLWQPNNLPSTVTELYAAFITCRIAHCLKQSGKISKDAVISKLEDVPEQSVHKTLQHLEKISFDALMIDKVTFTTEELAEIRTNCYGLLKFTESNKQLLSFLCYGLQVYFAAKYVFKLPYDEIYQLLNKSFLVEVFGKHGYYSRHYYDRSDPNSRSVHLYNMWILYCGIGGERCNQKVPAVMQDFLSSFLLNHDHYHQLHRLQKSLPVASSVPRSQKYSFEKLSSVEDWSTHRKFEHRRNMVMLAVYLFQCFQEAQDKNLCEATTESLHSRIWLPYKRLFPHQVASIGFFLLNSTPKAYDLDLHVCHIGDHGIHILHQYICSDKARRCEIKSIDFSDNDISGASLPLIGGIVRNSQPHKLRLSYNNIDKLEDILTAMIATKTVKVFEIMANNITTQRVNAITDILTLLKQLDISHNKLDNDGATFLAKGIAITNTLKVLDINDNNIGSSGFMAIMNALANNSSLKELKIKRNAIGKDGNQAGVTESAKNQTLKKFYGDSNKFGFLEIEAIAKVCISLEELYLNCNNVCQDGATAVASIINNNNTLKTLEINENNFGPSGSSIIMQALTNNTSLKTLRMNDNAIDQDGAPAIAAFIANNSTLKELSISNNNFGPSGATIIANVLTSNTSLEELYMEKNGIGQDGAKAFASAIASNKTLEILSLDYDNTISEERAIIIIRSLTSNNTLTNLHLHSDNRYTKNVKEEVSKINSARKTNDAKEVYVRYRKLVNKE